MSDSEDKEEAYYTALGKFIQCFAEVEMWMQLLLYAASGVPSKEVGKAVFFGVRAKEAAASVRRVYEAKGLSIFPLLSDTFSQLNIINDKRNDIVHFGLAFGADAMMV